MATTLLMIIMGSILVTSECCLYTVTCLRLVLPRHLCGPHVVPAHSLPTLHRWFSVVMYMAFLFTVIVVLLNVLIAQMSHTYRKLQESIDGTFNIIRATGISEVQKLAPIPFRWTVRN